MGMPYITTKNVEILRQAVTLPESDFACPNERRRGYFADGVFEQLLDVTKLHPSARRVISKSGCAPVK
jgi:hypothetical protein